MKDRRFDMQKAKQEYRLIQKYFGRRNYTLLEAKNFAT